MLRFQNDYSEGAHPNVLRALCDTNLCSTPGYGLDDDCRRAADAIRARFACPDADVHFLVGGTQTNQLAAAAFLRPWEAMVAADTGHINVHETGAIEATGHKVIAVPGADGKLTPAAIADAAAQHCAAPGVYDEHMVLPRMVYVSDATELGTVYTMAELTALRAACDAHGMYLYLDGARLAQALTAAGNDLQPEDLPQLCDAFYIGGTKNGLLFGEAMVIVNDALKPGFRRAMKRNGAMLAKGRRSACSSPPRWRTTSGSSWAGTRTRRRSASPPRSRTAASQCTCPRRRTRSSPSCRTRRSRGCRSWSRSTRPPAWTPRTRPCGS